MKYKVRFKSASGWQEEQFTDEAKANKTYDQLAELYKYVTLTFEEVVTSEVILRDSTAQ